MTCWSANWSSLFGRPFSSEGFLLQQIGRDTSQVKVALRERHLDAGFLQSIPDVEKHGASYVPHAVGRIGYPETKLEINGIFTESHQQASWCRVIVYAGLGLGGLELDLGGLGLRDPVGGGGREGAPGSPRVQGN